MEKGIDNRKLEASLLPGLREALLWKPNTPQLENAMTYAWEQALKSFIRAIEKSGAVPESGTTPVDPDSEAANPVWDLVINACAQAWPPGKLTWSQSPTELIVQIINERDEAQGLLECANRNLTVQASMLSAKDRQLAQAIKDRDAHAEDSRQKDARIERLVAASRSAAPFNDEDRRLAGVTIDELRASWVTGLTNDQNALLVRALKAITAPVVQSAIGELDLSPNAADLMVDHYIAKVIESQCPPRVHDYVREAVQAIFQQLRLATASTKPRSVEVLGADGKGVSAPCAIDGCALMRGEATLSTTGTRDATLDEAAKAIRRKSESLCSDPEICHSEPDTGATIVARGWQEYLEALDDAEALVLALKATVPSTTETGGPVLDLSPLPEGFTCLNVGCGCPETTGCIRKIRSATQERK